MKYIESGSLQTSREYDSEVEDRRPAAWVIGAWDAALLAPSSLLDFPPLFISVAVLQSFTNMSSDPPLSSELRAILVRDSTTR